MSSGSSYDNSISYLAGHFGRPRRGCAAEPGRSGGDVRVLSADLDKLYEVTSAPLFGAQRVEHALRARIGGVEAEGDKDVVPRELEAVEA